MFFSCIQSHSIPVPVTSRQRILWESPQALTKSRIWVSVKHMVTKGSYPKDYIKPLKFLKFLSTDSYISFSRATSVKRS